MTLLRRLLKRSRPGAWIAAVVLLVVVAMAVLAPLIATHDPEAIDLRHRLAPPLGFGGTTQHLLGTDGLGRDVFSRLVYGARISVSVGFAVVAVSGTLGTLLGLLAGYVGGWLDATLGWLMDVQLAFPVILLAVAMLAFLGSGLLNVVLVLSVANWVDYARVVRAEALSVKQREFVEGVRALGARPVRVMAGHVLPNSLAPTIVIATFSVASTIVAEASLSFLGLGTPPNVPSWGAMLTEGRSQLGSAWWLGVLPGLAIAVVVLSINVLGDWLRDLLDPRSIDPR